MGGVKTMYVWCMIVWNGRGEEEESEKGVNISDVWKVLSLALNPLH